MYEYVHISSLLVVDMAACPDVLLGSTLSLNLQPSVLERTGLLSTGALGPNEMNIRIPLGRLICAKNEPGTCWTAVPTLAAFTREQHS